MEGSAVTRLGRLGETALTLLLDFVLLKPIASFVWWFSQRANRLHFADRAELLRRMDAARARGRPLIVALNHVSWFDDPVIPMALYRTGQRAALELLAVTGLVAVCWMLAPRPLPAPAGAALALAGAAASARFGARKIWWTLGDLANLSDASVLRGKLALTRRAPPGLFLRAVLAVAERAIPWFMRSRTVRTIFVDRGTGEMAKRRREDAVERAVAAAERLEPVWIFFEGGRSKRPGEIAPARRGVGSLLLGLRERGLRPLVVVVSHQGMERLIPPGGDRFLSTGHRVEVRWTEFDAEASDAVAKSDAQAIADEIRAEVVRLQAEERADRAARD
jgi:1-acyl-sn-glycerol-3-phosphate acyltransferase